MNESAPDANCVNLPDGSCVGVGCMHDSREPAPGEWQVVPYAWSGYGTKYRNAKVTNGEHSAGPITITKAEILAAYLNALEHRAARYEAALRKIEATPGGSVHGESGIARRALEETP